MKTFSAIRRSLVLLACAVVPAALATPTISITSPASGSTIAAISSPGGQTITATATPTTGASIASVQFFDNGVSIGIVGGTSPFSINWMPSSAGTHTLTATVTDNSVPTTGTSPSVNTATATSIVSVTVVRNVTLLAPANNATFVQDSEVFFRSSASFSDSVVGNVQFNVDGTPLGAQVTQAPYNRMVTLSAVNGFTVGTHTVVATATSSDGLTVVNSSTATITIASPVAGDAAPTTTITAPAASTFFSVGQNVTVSATATDTAPGFIPSTAGGGVTFFADGDPITAVGSGETNPDLTSPYSITWRPTTAKTVELRSQTVDDKGNIRLSSPVSVTVATAVPSVSITSPAAGGNVTVSTATTITANASASTGATVTAVQFLVNGVAIGTDNTAPYSISWTPTTTGSATLTAVVTDSFGAATTSAGVTVNVNVAPPTVAVTAPTSGRVVAVGSSVALTASATPGTGATITAVDFLVGSNVVGTATTAPYTATWIPTSTGAASITARVTDSNGNVVTSGAVPVTVATAPTVAISSPASGGTVAAGTATTISATAAAGSPLTVASVQFLVDGVSIGTDTSAPFSMAWTPATLGSAVLTTIVTDSSGAMATSAPVNVTVSTAAPTVAISAPTTGTVVTTGTPVTISATTTAPTGVTIAQVQFLSGPTILGTDTTAPYSIVWTPSSAGNNAITARVLDSNNNSATSTPITITVVGPGTVSITSPANNASLPAGTAVNLTAAAAPSAGAAVTSVEFFAGTTSLGTATTAPYTISWTPTTAGPVSLTARVTDSANLTNTSAAVNVTVTAGAPVVAITAPLQGASFPVGSPITFTSSATAAAGSSIIRVDYLVNGAVVGGSVNGPAYSFSWTPPTAGGVFTIAARATDSGGATSTSSGVAISVGSGGSTTLPVNLAITGSINIPAGSTRALTATSTATGIDHIDLLYDGSVVATDNTAPYNFLFTAPITASTGTHQLVARVVDTTGASGNSTPLAITIVSPIGDQPLISIATPAPNSFLGPNVATTISGTVTDADGGVSSVQVFINSATTGLASGGIANVSGSTWSINWITPTVAGIYSIAAIANDTSGNAIAAVPVNVTVGDSASPTLSLVLLPGTSGSQASSTLPSGAVRNIVANATASSGRAVVRVEFFVDGTKVGEDTMAPFTYRYVAPALGTSEQSRTFVFSARATDNAGAARDAFVPLLVVQPVGVPPSIHLITPADNASVFPNTDVSMAATAVPAPGASIASVQFFVNGNTTGITTTNPVGNAPYVGTFRPTAPGIYTIDAIATDDRGNTSVSNPATITAAFATPTIVFTSPNPNATARATPGVPLTLAATATVQTGTGASILLVEFLLDGVQIGADTTAPYTFSWLPTTAQLGQHVLTARVTDTNSQTATTNPITVNVANVIGSPPTVSVVAQPIPSPFGLQTASTVNFLATAVATGTGSTLRSVEIFLNDISIGLAARVQSTNFYRIAYDLNRFDFTTVTPIINDVTGAVTYPVRLYAIARDSNDNQTVSATTNLVINPATSAPPSIQLVSLTPTNITAGTQFFIGAILNDSDGTVTSIQLYANGSLVQTVGNPQQGAVLQYLANNAGRFDLYAVAIDDTGNTMVSSPAIVVNVTAVNAPTTTLTRPTDDSTRATVGSPVFLEGTAVNTSTTQVPSMQFVATAASGARQIINGIRVGTTTTYRAIWTPVNPDTYTITTQSSVGVIQGTSSNSRRVVVTEILGLAPSVTLTRSSGVAGVPGSASTASTADFCATATDPDGSIVDVEFFLNRNSVGKARKDPQGNTWRVTAAFAGLQPGATEVVALATDSSGNIAASPTGNINVTAASSIAPSITVTPSTTNPAFNRQVQLRSNARDSDGNVTQVQYFANATAIATSTNSGSLFLSNWTPAVSGLYYLWAVATDNTGITTVSPTIEINVRQNNPVLESSAFILQTYQDIANTTNINPLVFDQLDEQLAAGTLSRADIIVSPLTANGGVSMMDLSGFQAPVNLLATYFVLMGEWPTPANYTSFLNTARFSLPGAVTNILNSNEYFAKFGIVPTTALLDSPTSALPAELFLNRLHQAAGIPPPLALDRVTFRNNNVLSATRGRGYTVVGLQQAIAEFVTNSNSTNTALLNKAKAAALFYQLTKPPVTMSVDEITARIDALLKLPNMTAIADAVLKDVLYGYRYVTITRQPQSLVVAPRSGVILSVEAQGAPPLAYQWLLNGAPIAGATGPVLSFTNADTGRVGSYTVAITSSAATATSDPATLTLSTTPTRLANISTRGVTNGGNNVLIGGFVVAGTNQTQTRQMLIRVIGPSLAGAPFNVQGTLADPRLELYAGNSPTPVLTNDNWASQQGGAAQVAAIQQATTRAGAFTLNSNSLDAVVLATLPPGNYTVQAKGPANNPNASGVVLIEAYDVTPNANAAGRAMNVSTRGSVGTGSNILIAGFVVNGGVSRRVLIRGVGPTLTRFGLPANSVLADPQLTLVNQDTGKTLATDDDWASNDDTAGVIAAASSAAGAFALANGSKDAALIVMLPPGAYTVQLSGVNNGTGIAIVEVYDVDP